MVSKHDFLSQNLEKSQTNNICCWKSEKKNTLGKLSFPASMNDDRFCLKLLNLELLITLLCLGNSSDSCGLDFLFLLFLLSPQIHLHEVYFVNRKTTITLMETLLISFACTCGCL